MNFLKYYNEKIIKQDLINKFKFNNLNEIPYLKKITLNFGCKNFTIHKFATTMLALEIIVKKKSTLTISKHANVLLKIQKGQPAGCKVVLKKKMMYDFLTKLILDILPKLKNFLGFKIKLKISIFSFKLYNNEIVLQEFEEQFPLFNNLPNLDIDILTNSKNKKELLFLIKSLKFPIKNFKRISGRVV
jgi:large subunit ribosomal protein L5